jgi:hypothetical protein
VSGLLHLREHIGMSGLWQRGCIPSAAIVPAPRLRVFYANILLIEMQVVRDMNLNLLFY